MAAKVVEFLFVLSLSLNSYCRNNEVSPLVAKGLNSVESIAKSKEKKLENYNT